MTRPVDNPSKTIDLTNLFVAMYELKRRRGRAFKDQFVQEVVLQGGSAVSSEVPTGAWLHWNFAQGSDAGLTDMLQDVVLSGSTDHEWTDNYYRSCLYNPLGGSTLLEYTASLPTPPDPTWAVTMVGMGRLSQCGSTPVGILSDGGDESSLFGLWGFQTGTAEYYQACGSTAFNNPGAGDPNWYEYTFHSATGFSMSGYGGTASYSCTPNYPSTLELRVPNVGSILSITVYSYE